MDTPYIFIVGVGRSGTSLLQSMLDSHSKIVFLPETHFFRKYVCTQRFWRSSSTTKLKQTLLQDRTFHRLGMDLHALLSDNPIRESNLNLVEIYQKIAAKYLRGQSSYIGDKDPKLLGKLRKLYSYFPNAKIIHIYRDPREIVLSKTKALWSKNRPFWLNALVGQIQINVGRDDAITLFKSRLIEISYEDLVRSPTSTLKRITSFLEICYEDQMLNFQTSARKFIIGEEMAWKKTTMQPLLSNNIAKWRNELTPRQVKYIEWLSEDYFEKLGYTRRSPKPSGLHKFLFLAFVKVSTFFYQHINRLV